METTDDIPDAKGDISNNVFIRHAIAELYVISVNGSIFDIRYNAVVEVFDLSDDVDSIKTDERRRQKL